MRTLSIGILCGALLALGACSDSKNSSSSDGGAGGTSSGGSIKTVKQMVTAKDGGKVEAQGATIDFPAGALDKDLEISVASVSKTGLPDSKNVAAVVYELGPSGTQFKKPVTLTLDFDGTAPKGSTAKVAWLDEKAKKWMPLDDSKVTGQSASGTTMHFTKFTVMFVVDSNGNGTQTGGQCAEMDTSCGGDLEGTWEFTASCATLDPATLFKGDPTNPLATCKGIGVAITVDITGTITFNADKTFSMDQSVDYSSMISFPKSCLGGTCDVLKKDGSTDVTEDADNCLKDQGSGTDTNKDMGTYTTSGNTLTTTPDADGGGPGMADDPNEYCVKDGVLTAKVMSSDGTIIYYVAKKK